MRIDGKSFETYQLESLDSIRNRIAYQHKTLPEFIVLEESPGNQSDSWVSYDLVQIMKSYPPSEFNKLYEKYNTMFQFEISVFAYLWYIHALQEGKKSDPYIDMLLDEYLKQYNFSLNKLQDGLSNWKKTFERNLIKFNRAQVILQRNIQDFERLKPTHITGLEVVRVKREFVFEVDYDIFELFNNLKMSRQMPFATINNYYKILKDFVPDDSWNYTDQRIENDFANKLEVLYIKTLNVRNEPLSNYKRVDPRLYTTVAIFFETPQEESKRTREARLKQEAEQETIKKAQEALKKEKDKKQASGKVKRKGQKSSTEKKEEPVVIEAPKEYMYNEEKIPEEEQDVIVKSSKVYMRIDSSTNSDFTVQDILKQILSNFPGKIRIISSRQIQIKGEFLVPDFQLDRAIFLDLLMNDSFVSQFFHVDERLRLQKERGGVYMYFTPNSREEDSVACSITEQVVEKTNLKIIAKDPLLKVDSSYLRVKITRVQTEEGATRFVSVFAKLLSLYRNNRAAIITKYEKYINNLETQLEAMRREIESSRKRSTRTTQMLKDVNPDQFISGYSRWLCPTKRAPRIVGTPDEQKEVKELEDQGKQVMLFPKKASELNSEYPQYYYACDHHPQDQFVGLRINKLSNSDKYPIVPCCYRKDQRVKDRSIWREYYEEGKDFAQFYETPALAEEDEKHIYITNKILPPKRFGMLIRDVESFLETIEVGHKFLRQGVSRTYNSVIESLIAALDPDFDAYTVESLNNKVVSIREALVERVYTSNVYQQAYTYSPETIENYLKDFNRYLDPKIFTRLLEEYFKCYIFIFSQSEQHPFGILSSPVHAQAYLELERDPRRRYVFLYEHWGSELDKAEYPQCEVIIMQDERTGEREFSYSPKYNVVKRTLGVFQELYLTSRDDDKINISFVSPILGQGIDHYGKTRMLQFRELCVLTDPLPPLAVRQTFSYSPTDPRTALSFLKTEKVTDVKEHIVDGRVVGFAALKGDVSFYIPLFGMPSNLLSETTLATPCFLAKNSALDVYNRYHRLSRYLIEYTLYLFSLFYNSNPGKINALFIQSFAKSNIEVDPTFSYGDIPRTFSLENNLLRNGKLVVHNTEIVKRLIYTLRLRLRSSFQQVLRYSEYKYLQRYYDDIRDFQQTDVQPIIYGQAALLRWIRSQRYNYTLFSSIQHRESSLLLELSKYDTSKLFVLVFFASWHTDSLRFINRITVGSKRGKPANTMLTKYSEKVTFVFVDVSVNKDLATGLEINSLPSIHFYRVREGTLISLEKISGSRHPRDSEKLMENVITSHS